MGEKTEKASPKKLRDARNKGQVAKSQDFPSAFTFMVSISLILGLADSLYESLGAFLIQMFQNAGSETALEKIPAFFRQAAFLILTVSVPIAAAVACVGVLVNFLIIGPVFSLEAMKPDIKKLDPIKGIQNKFKMKTFVELLKSMAKIIIASYLIYGVIEDLIPSLIKAPSMNMVGNLVIIKTFLNKVILKVGIFFLAIAVFDLAYQKKNFAKEMMMEKFETKQEYKNSEGDPQIKGKRKEIAREIAYSSGPAAGVKKSKAVITNPVHLAIAIGYEPHSPAPYILAMGKNYSAQLIIREAEQHDIPILRNISLAHQLFEEGVLFDFVPESSYEPIAEIVRWIASLEEEEPF
jgi:type III secretion protein U